MPSDSTPTSAPEVLLRSARTISVKQGQPVFDQGTAGDAAYLVVSGKVKISQQTAPIPVTPLQSRTRSGELSLFDGAPRRLRRTR